MITKLSSQGSHFLLLRFSVFSFSLFGGGALPEVTWRSYKLNAGKEVKIIHCEKRGGKGLMIWGKECLLQQTSCIHQFWCTQTHVMVPEQFDLQAAVSMNSLLVWIHAVGYPCLAHLQIQSFQENILKIGVTVVKYCASEEEN